MSISYSAFIISLLIQKNHSYEKIKSAFGFYSIFDFGKNHVLLQRDCQINGQHSVSYPRCYLRGGESNRSRFGGFAIRRGNGNIGIFDPGNKKCNIES